MSVCKYINDGICLLHSEPLYKEPCHEGPCPDHQSLTNADRIRAMTDEELAEFINKHDCHTNLYGYDPEEAILVWLKKEAEG